jgi:hypothetical protein
MRDSRRHIKVSRHDGILSFVKGRSAAWFDKLAMQELK